MEEDLSREFRYFLDVEKQNEILIIFSYSEDFLTLAKFVLLYQTKTEDSFKEVVKYDYSQRESLNVHYYFKKHARKEFLDLPTTVNTLFELKENLESNWQKYLLKFKGD